MPSVSLKGILLCAALVGGLTLERISAKEHVNRGTQIAYCHMLLTYASLLGLLLLSQVCCGYMPKVKGPLWRTTLMMSLIHSSLGWRIPPSSREHPVINTGDGTTKEVSLKCEGGSKISCRVKLRMDGSMPLTNGYFIGLKVLDDNGNEHKGRLTVENVTTMIPYSADVVMPYYSLAHKLIVKSSEPDVYKKFDQGPSQGDSVWTKFNTKNGTTLGHVDWPEGQFSMWEKYDRSLKTLADRWKCGEFLRQSDELRQVYTVMPVPHGGWIQWVQTGDVVQRIRMCLDLITKTCVEGEFSSNEEIVMSNDHFDLHIKRTTRMPDAPSATLISRYTVGNNADRVELDSWRVMHRPLRGNTKYNDMGAVQGSCVFTKKNRCEMGHMPLSELVSWTLKDETQCATGKSENGPVAVIIGIAALVGIAAAVIVGLNEGAKCNACGVDYRSNTYPDYQDKMAANYADVEEYLPGLEKALPNMTRLTESSGSAYAANIVVHVQDYDKSYVQISVKTAAGLEVEKEKDGSLRRAVVEKCLVNLVGGVGSCHVMLDAEGDMSHLMVASGDKSTIVLNRMISVEAGRHEIEIGIEGSHSRADKPVICFGDVGDEICSMAKDVEYTTNPDIKTVDEGLNDNVGKGKDISFKELWDILSEWWEKLILVALICLACFLLVVTVIMSYRMVICAMYLLGLKDVTATHVTIGRYRNSTGDEMVIEAWPLEKGEELKELSDGPEGERPEFVVLMTDTGVPADGGHGGLDWMDGDQWKSRGFYGVCNYDPAMSTGEIDNAFNCFQPWANYSSELKILKTAPYWLKTTSVGTVRVAEEMPVLKGVGGDVSLIRDVRLIWKSMSNSSKYSWGYRSKDQQEMECVRNDRLYKKGDRYKKGDTCLPLFMPLTMSRSTCKSSIVKGHLRNPGCVMSDSCKSAWGRPAVKDWYRGPSEVQQMRCDGPPIAGLIGAGEICNGLTCKPDPAQLGSVGCLSDYIMANTDKIEIMMKPRETSGGESKQIFSWEELVSAKMVNNPDGWSAQSCGFTEIGRTKDPESWIKSATSSWTDSWEEATVMMDTHDHDKLKYRAYLVWPYILTNMNEFTQNQELASVHPLATHPQRTSKGGTLVALMLRDTKASIMSDASAITIAKRMLGFVSGEVVWKVESKDSLIAVYGSTTSATLLINGRLTKVTAPHDNTELSEYTCMMSNGRKLKAGLPGPQRANCLCMNKRAVCLKEDHVAIIPTENCQDENYNEYKVSMYRGTYRCGSEEVEFEHGTGEVIVKGAGWITNNNWATKQMYYPGDILELRGHIEVWDETGVKKYGIWNSDSGECSYNFKCAWDKQRTLMIIIVAIPGAFLILLFLLAIIKCWGRMWILSRKASLAKAATGVADSIMGNPVTGAKRRAYLNTMA